MIRETFSISYREIPMSEKDDTQIPLELRTADKAGVLNSNQPRSARYTNSIKSEQAGTNFSNQITNDIIRRDQDRLENVQNRTCMVVQEGTPSEYEMVKFRIGVPKNNDAPLEIKKTYTRNAESKTYFLTPPWSFDDTSLGNYKRYVTLELHTYAVEGFKAGEATPALGEFYTQIYEDHTQEAAKLLSKNKGGLAIKNLNYITSAGNMFASSDASLLLEVNTPALITPPQDAVSSVLPSTSLPAGSLVTEVKKYWGPSFCPCAAKANANGTRPASPKSTVGKNRLAFEGDGTSKQDFGPRVRPNTGINQFHEGQDMSWYPKKLGYPIVSVASGKVASIYMDKTSKTTGSRQPKTIGICIISIKHDLPTVLETAGYEVFTRYMHMFKVAEKTPGVRLQVGDAVAAGEVIAFMGGEEGWPGSGNTTGSHLHFEVCVRKKTDKGYIYDQYKGLNSGGKRSKLGPVDPLHFNYPKLATFAIDKEQQLQDQLPITKVEYDRRARQLEQETKAKTEKISALSTR